MSDQRASLFRPLAGWPERPDSPKSAYATVRPMYAHSRHTDRALSRAHRPKSPDLPKQLPRHPHQQMCIRIRDMNRRSIRRTSASVLALSANAYNRPPPATPAAAHPTVSNSPDAARASPFMAASRSRAPIPKGTPPLPAPGSSKVAHPPSRSAPANGNAPGPHASAHVSPNRRAAPPYPAQAPHAPVPPPPPAQQRLLQLSTLRSRRADHQPAVRHRLGNARKLPRFAEHRTRTHRRTRLTK